MGRLELEGFLLLNKPADLTSFQCIGRVRRLLGTKGVRVGHAGTLDKFATGLLIIGIGRKATRCLGLLSQLPKTYVATGKLGELTTTYDLSGELIETSSKVITLQELLQALNEFGGGYEQVPPIYSALKHQGRRLSDLSRNSINEIDVQAVAVSKRRFIKIYELQLQNFEFPYFTIKAQVSAGTYIRSLINDLAFKVGSCAVTTALCRTQVGELSLLQSVELSGLTLEQIQTNLISISDLQARLGLNF